MDAPRLLHLFPLLLATLAPVVGAPAPILTRTDVQPYYFSIPAPRGQILDAAGRPLARTVTVQRLRLTVPTLDEETPEAFVAWVRKKWPTIAKACPSAHLPSDDELRLHFQHRRRLPVPLGGTCDQAPAIDNVDLQPEYVRDYPGKKLASHTLGYVTSTGAPLRGPIRHQEPLWMEIEGRAGLEASFNAELTGKPGLMMVLIDHQGRTVEREVIDPPIPGADVVTTLRLETQQAVEKALAASPRPGAMVVVDASTGNLVAMASSPSFDPNTFSRGISTAEFAELTGNPDDPLFHRAISSAYPPGSIFKPFVGLAGLGEGLLTGSQVFACGPEFDIDGRVFKNWSATEEGLYDLRSALIRSCNTYFYQAGLQIGDRPILQTARTFGFGQAPRLPLGGVVAGSLPKQGLSAQGIANLSIGQGDVLATPVQAGMAMAALANGRCRPRARLVTHVQTQDGHVVKDFPAVRESLLMYSESQIGLIREGMNGVVNHRSGTAHKARLENTRVFGKTGTAQWSHNGKMANAVWFAGYVLDAAPPLAFALVLEGRDGESLFAGATAAPVVHDALEPVFDAPGKFGIAATRSAVPLEDYPLSQVDPNGTLAMEDADPYDSRPEPAAWPAPERRLVRRERPTFEAPANPIHETIQFLKTRFFRR